MNRDTTTAFRTATVILTARACDRPLVTVRSGASQAPGQATWTTPSTLLPLHEGQVATGCTASHS